MIMKNDEGTMKIFFKKLLFLLLINEIERTYENILCEEFKNQGAISKCRKTVYVYYSNKLVQ